MFTEDTAHISQIDSWSKINFGVLTNLYRTDATEKRDTTHYTFLVTTVFSGYWAFPTVSHGTLEIFELKALIRTNDYTAIWANGACLFCRNNYFVRYMTYYTDDFITILSAIACVFAPAYNNGARYTTCQLSRFKHFGNSFCQNSYAFNTA